MKDVKKATITRIISAAIGLPIYVLFLYTDKFFKIPTLLVSLVITVVCLLEYYQIAHKSDLEKPHIGFGVISAIALNVLMYLYAFGGWGYVRMFDARALLFLTTILIVALLVYRLFAKPLTGGIYSLAVTAFGILYIVLFFSHTILIRALPHGFQYLIVLNAVIMINDAAAYFGGISLGKHKTNFPASPNKSYEGYAFGLIFSVITMLVCNKIIIYTNAVSLFTWEEAIVLGIALSIIGHLGDLIESAIKRDGAIKDSGSIIPGHGGMWDVFDALILATPIFYYYLINRNLM
ncbi:MAG: phosphatidate cytidylyltransferase [Spirochaetes bacterium]|nr:phosphatidate cytidylyltransferase [Spirochaetota bacterium]